MKMRRYAPVLLLCIALASCQLSCAGFKASETSGKTDATINYYESWLVGAQVMTQFFGSYAPAAQVCISTAYTALELYRKASDWYAAGKISAQDLAASLAQVQDAIQKIVALGNSAGIQ